MRANFRPRHWVARILVILVTALVPQVCVGASEQHSSANEWTTSITVVMDDNYPPFVFKDTQGEIKGYLPDLWRLWSVTNNIPVDLKAV